MMITRQRMLSVAKLLGFGADVRVQNPDLMRTAGVKPRWYIRPYVDKINPTTGRIEPKQERIYLGLCSEMTKRDAIRQKNEAMMRINRRQYVVQAQIRFGDFLDQYEREYVRKPENLAASTRSKYESHIKNHIRPAFGDLCMAEVTTQAIDAFLTAKTREGLAYATRLDLRNLLCGIFTQAGKWGCWKEQNPALNATAGRERHARTHHKLTIEQTRLLLDALPPDVSLICKVALCCQLRISEVFGIQWKHVDLIHGIIRIEQRWYRGDLDVVKTSRSRRSRPVDGPLLDEIRRLHRGEDDEFVFSVRTHVGQWDKPRECRDDRNINQHFLRPAAKKLGLYHPGFGFHAFRREGITAMAAETDAIQAMRAAGHTKMDTTLLYGLEDEIRQRRAMSELQRKLLGTSHVEPERKM